MPELLLRGLMLLAEIALEIIIGYVFYTTGWLALRLLTLGHYPNLPLRISDPTGSRSAWAVSYTHLKLPTKRIV